MTTATATKHAYRRPWLYPKQEAAIFHSARYVVCEASTKAGKTVGCALWLLEQAAKTGGPNRNYWWVAPVYAQAEIAYRRTKRALQKNPSGPLAIETNDTERTITLDFGAVLHFKTAEKPDNLYGEDVYACVMDEATRMRRAAWVAVRSTLTATRGPVRVIGNVKGSANWAYDLAREAERRMRAGDPQWHYAKLTAWDAVEGGVLAKEEIDDAASVLSVEEFQELFLAEPAANLSLIYAPFSEANIITEADFVPDAGPIYLSYDWGYTDPTYIGLHQYRDGRLYLFDELSGAGRSEQEWVREVVRRLSALPAYDGPALEDWERIWQRQAKPTRWPSVWPEIAAGDPSAVQMRATLKELGIGARAAKHVKHPVESGQDVLRALIEAANGSRRFFVHPRCTVFLEAVRRYRAKELDTGQFDRRPDPSPENHRWSHPCDAERYLAWAMRRQFGIRVTEGSE